MIKELQKAVTSTGEDLALLYDHLGKYRLYLGGKLFATAEDLTSAIILFDLTKNHLAECLGE